MSHPYLVELRSTADLHGSGRFAQGPAVRDEFILFSFFLCLSRCLQIIICDSHNLVHRGTSVVTLTDSNFNDKVARSKDLWMVEFYCE